MSDTIPDSTPQKQCSKCKKWFPATKEHFHAHKDAKYGLKPNCKACISAREKAKRSARREFIPEGHKKCAKCKQLFPATADNFHKHPEGTLKLSPRCKKCIAEYRNTPEYKKRQKVLNQAYHTNNRQELKEYYQNWYRQNKTKADEYRKSYWQTHQERRKAIAIQRGKRHRIKHAEMIKQRDKARRHSDKGKAYFRMKNTERRARKRSTSGTYTVEQIQDQLKRQKHKCYYCQAQLKKAKGKYIYHVEHTFPLSRVAGTDIPANDISYLVLACPTCNLSKGDKFPWEWAEGGRLL